MLKNEKASITLFVLTSMLFWLMLLLNMFMNISHKQQAETAEIEKIRSDYAKSINNIDDIYEQLAKP